MAWQTESATNWITGTSTMTGSSALSRTWQTFVTTATLTSFHTRVELGLGASGTTYSAFGTGVAARQPDWIHGMSYTPSGVAVPNILTDPDNDAFIYIDHFGPDNVRQTINQAGSPAYADLFAWANVRKGRIQLPNGSAGTVNFHVGNLDAGSTATAWRAFIRTTFAVKV